MSADNQTSRLLSELDLSEYETRAYLSVIEGGVMVAREISDRASIPYAKVYQTLNDLIEKQLITGDEGRPKKFRARPPEIAINDRLATIERNWQAAHAKRKDLLSKIMPELQDLYNASDVVEEEEQGVWNISGSTNINSRLTRLVAKVNDRIIIVSGNYTNFKDNFLKTIVENTEVPIELVVSDPIEESEIDTIHVVDKLGQATTIILDDFAMLSIAETQKGKYSAGEYTAVLTQIHELVKSFRTNYQRMITQ